MFFKSKVEQNIYKPHSKEKNSLSQRLVNMYIVFYAISKIG